MSLTDTDKHSLDRITPTPNTHDAAEGARMAHGTQSISPRVSASTTPGFVKTTNGQILANDGSVNVGLFGFDSAGKMVVKVAKAGVNVLTATDDQLVFNSGQDMLKIVQKNTASLVVSAGGSTSKTVAHGLSFLPAIICYILPPYGPPTYFPNPAISVNVATMVVGAVSHVEVDATGVTFSVVNDGSGLYTGTYNFTYYLMQETAN